MSTDLCGELGDGDGGLEFGGSYRWPTDKPKPGHTLYALEPFAYFDLPAAFKFAVFKPLRSRADFRKNSLAFGYYPQALFGATP